MRDYELLYIVSGDKSEEEATKVTDEVNAALLKAGGKVESENPWGRRRLSYEIANEDHGWYVITRFSAPPDKLADFDRALRLNKAVVRTVLVSASEIPSEEEAAKADEVVAEKEKPVEKKTPAPKAAKPAEPAEPAEPKRPETAEERKERQAKLDEKLGQILKDS